MHARVNEASNTSSLHLFTNNITDCCARLLYKSLHAYCFCRDVLRSVVFVGVCVTVLINMFWAEYLENG